MAYKYRVIKALGKPISVILKIEGRTKVVAVGQSNFDALVKAVESGADDDTVLSLLSNVSILDRILKDSEEYLNENEVDVPKPSPQDFEDDDTEWIDCPVCVDGLVDCDNCEPGEADDCDVCEAGTFVCIICDGSGAVPDMPDGAIEATVAATQDADGVVVGGGDAPPADTVTDAATTVTKAAAWSLEGEQVTGGGKSLVDDKKFSIFLKDGVVHVNSIPLDNKLTDLILRYVANNEFEKVGPLAMFLCRVIANPAPNSRTELFEFMSHHSYRLAPDGRFYAYKGVSKKDRKSFRSGNEEVTIVKPDGTEETIKGRIPHENGTILKMERDLVDDNSGVACGVGLHIGSEKYVTEYYTGNEHKGAIQLRVLVDPEHVIAVPRDHPDGKMRTCQLEVVGPASQFVKKKGTVVL